ncbi:WXG100 family type VII secretion target [Streptomyces sp. NPDC000594]|uniref:WXG100 family type VII secretion target n=1 Tax=Streptomyces sp. NPDC000594 TaxID=3154261 RepID=UPI0033263FCF
MSGVNSTSFAQMNKAHDMLVTAGNELRREHEAASATVTELSKYWQAGSSSSFQRMMNTFNNEMQNALKALEEIETKIEQITGAQIATDEDALLAVDEMNRVLEGALQGK